MTVDAPLLIAPSRLASPRRPGRRALLLAFAAILAVVASLLVLRPWSAEGDTYAADARTVTATAGTQVRLLLEVAAGTAADDAVERIVAAATGEWRSQVDGGRFTRAVRAGAVEPGAAVAIDSSAVVDVRADTAQVLVAASSGSRAFLFRVGLERVEGRWRVAAMQAAR